MKTPGTLAFLLRWHLVPFLIGAVLASIGGYQLWTYVPPAPAPQDAAFGSPFVDFFQPLMWLSLLAGLAIAGRAFIKARAMAR